MSPYVSSIYRRYTSTEAPIDHELLCIACGYNLRGLNYGRNCPECGRIIQALRTSPDLLLECDQAARSRWRLGLGLGAAAVFISMAVENFWLGSVIFGVGFGSLHWLAVVVLGNLLLWLTAVVLLTPQRINVLGGWVPSARVAARVLTALWPAAFIWVMWGSPFIGRVALAVFCVFLGCVFLGASGSLLVLYLMLRVAGGADLETAYRRLVTAMWLLPITTFLILFLPLIPWAALFPVAVMLVIPLLVLATWLWAMLLVARALLEMLNHIRWAEIHRDHESHREERIAAVRAALDAEALSVVRPLPGGGRE